MLKKRKGQSVLEYVIILAIVITAIVAFANLALKQKITDSLDHAANEMEQMTNRIGH